MHAYADRNDRHRLFIRTNGANNVVSVTAYPALPTMDGSIKSAELRSSHRVDLDMSHVGLGTLDEVGVMVLFGNSHSRLLTQGLPHTVNDVVDAKERRLYPAYFMTDLAVPVAAPLRSFALWNSVRIETGLSRYGETILESTYSLTRAAASDDQPSASDAAVTMRANSLFILDPSVFVTKHKQVSAPRSGMISAMPRLQAPPRAIQASGQVRAGAAETVPSTHRADPFRYCIESGRDTAAGHPLMFAKFPQIIEIGERTALRALLRGRISEESLDAIDLMRRKTFYFNNAFAGTELTLHTCMAFRPCDEPHWKSNPRVDYAAVIECETEVYAAGELLASARSEKVLAHPISQQALAQDARRLFKPLFLLPGVHP